MKQLLLIQVLLQKMSSVVTNKLTQNSIRQRITYQLPICETNNENLCSASISLNLDMISMFPLFLTAPRRCCCSCCCFCVDCGSLVSILDKMNLSFLSHPGLSLIIIAVVSRGFLASSLVLAT